MPACLYLHRWIVSLAQNFSLGNLIAAWLFIFLLEQERPPRWKHSDISPKLNITGSLKQLESWWPYTAKQNRCYTADRDVSVRVKSCSPADNLLYLKYVSLLWAAAWFRQNSKIRSGILGWKHVITYDTCSQTAF